MEGRWDRIDERDGGITIVDFKSAEVVKPEDALQRAKESLKSGQLGLYALAYREARGVTPSAVEANSARYGSVRSTGNASRIMPPQLACGS